MPEPPARTFIRDLKPSQYIDASFAIQNCQLGRTKQDKPYIKCLLADRTGRTPGRMWNATEETFDALPTDGFVWVQGQTQPYQGEIQIIIQQVHPYDPTPRELGELMPSTRHSVDQMFMEVSRLMGTLEHPAVAALVQKYLEDQRLMDEFCQAPAAQNLHHAYLGGLLEHTLGLLRVAEALLPLYPRLNRDIVLAGLFLHDLGKCAELQWQKGFGYTTAGQLVGHIALGARWLHEKAALCANPEHDDETPTPVPEPILLALEHIILSHHGQPEYGALKIPATPEAIFVAHVDNLDAKMNMALDNARPLDQDGNPLPTSNAQGGEFSEKVWALDNVRLYRPDPTSL